MKKPEDRRLKTEDRSLKTEDRSVLRASLPACSPPQLSPARSATALQAGDVGGGRSALRLHPSSSPASGGQVPHPSDSRGVALVLTLGILALVTLLLIAFVTSMRVENMASRNFNDLIRARLLAQAAVDEAVATIRLATPVINAGPPLVTYVTAPGAIFTNVGGVGWTMVTNFTLIVPAAGFVDLNAGDWITGTNGSAPLPPPPHTPIYAGWVPVVANAQILGRFAYWVDDESAKVNINVAGTRGNDPEGWTPAAIDLLALFSANPPFYNDQVDITNFIALNHLPFDTLECIKLVTNTATGNYINQDKYYTNQFYMTVNSSSPDLTPWGTKRLNASSLVATAATKAAAVNGIVNALADANLTAWFGQTFAGKYPITAQQIAANIVDYIDQDNVPTDSGTPLDTTPPAYLGLEVTPYLSEIHNSNTLVHVQSPGNPRTITVNVAAAVELWNMYTNSWPIPANTEVLVTNMPSITLVNSNVQTGVLTTTNIFPSNIIIPVPAGPFSVGLPNATAQYNAYYSPAPDSHTVTFSADDDTNSVTTITYGSGVATAIFRTTAGASAGRIDYAQMVLQPITGQGTVTIDTNGIVSLPAAVSLGFARISEVNDPRVKPVSTDWHPVLSVPGSLGLINTCYNPALPTSPIQADGENSCHIISGGSRDRGTMYPGELGYIHTGIPWRTFWLQPEPIAEVTAGMIPDWAVLDLFSATDTTNVIGRININAAITNANAAATPPAALPPSRIRPLMALLINNVAGYPAYVPAVASTNVYYFGNIWTNSVVLPALQTRFPALSGLPAFALVGEICEVPGLGLAIPPPALKSIAEAPVRGIANLITPRSNTFTIWAIAQALRVPAGTTLTNVLGEAKVQAIVERYENPPGTVRFRTLYYRYHYQ